MSINGLLQGATSLLPWVAKFTDCLAPESLWPRGWPETRFRSVYGFFKSPDVGLFLFIFVLSHNNFNNTY